MAVIEIHYDDGNKKNLGYQGVYLHCLESEKEYSTGNFVKDWWDMRKYMLQNLLDSEPHFSHSSTVDNFIMDGAPYDSGYLHMVNNKPILKYRDANLSEAQNEEIYEGIEFFVPKGTQPTFVELKEMCK